LLTEIIVVPDNPGALESVKLSAQHVAQDLSSAGSKLRTQTSVCFTKADLQKAVAAALTRSNMVLILGGLGKESGGIANKAVAQGLELPLEPDDACFAAIREFSTTAARPCSPKIPILL